MVIARKANPTIFNSPWHSDCSFILPGTFNAKTLDLVGDGISRHLTRDYRYRRLFY